MFHRLFLTANQKRVMEKMYNLEIVQKVSGKNPNQQSIQGLLDIGKSNAEIYLNRNYLGEKLSLLEENNLFKVLVTLKKTLGLRKTPRRIECYDISHLSGKFTYGSMVVFIDGKPKKSFYRLFKTKEQNDDFANHKEVLTRRLQRSLDYYLQKRQSEEIATKAKLDPVWELPDLIIVDGGKGQLSSDAEVIQEFIQKFETYGLVMDVEICALAKKKEEVFLPGNLNSILFSNDTSFLIQRIRDEAHRFAIKNNRSSRLRSIRNTSLSKLPGIGPKTEQKILKEFGSIKNLSTNLETNPILVYEILGKTITDKLKKFLLK